MINKEREFLKYTVDSFPYLYIKCELGEKENTVTEYVDRKWHNQKIIISNPDFDNFKKEVYSYLEKWKEENCEKISLNENICNKCCKERGNSIGNFWNDWNKEMRVSCLLSRQSYSGGFNLYVNAPVVGRCPYKLEHILSFNGEKVPFKKHLDWWD